MKKLLYFAAIAVVLLLSCKSEEEKRLNYYVDATTTLAYAFLDSLSAMENQKNVPESDIINEFLGKVWDEETLGAYKATEHQYKGTFFRMILWPDDAVALTIYGDKDQTMILYVFDDHIEFTEYSVTANRESQISFKEGSVSETIRSSGSSYPVNNLNIILNDIQKSYESWENLL